MIRAVLGIAAAGTVLVAPVGPARADDGASPQTTQLCGDTDVPCSIQVAPTWPEGTSGEVAVTGHPDVEVGVRAYRVRFEAGRLTALAPVGPAVRVRTDDHGFGTADLRLPAVPDDASGGPVLFTLDDVAPGDPAGVLGTWSVLASRRPLVLGDGYDAAKPVGVTLDLEVTAAVAGSTYDVQVRRGGQWESMRGDGAEPCADPTGACVVPYVVPRGLDPTSYDVRLVNEATGTAVAGWSVRPSAAGAPRQRATVVLPPVGDGVPGALTADAGAGSNPVPRPRSRSLDVPDVGSLVAGAGRPVEHDPALVRRTAGLLGLAAVLVCLTGAVRAGRAGRGRP